jgi:hypothetical protein
MKSFYLSNVTAWAPGLNDDTSLWEKWANDEAQIEQIKESPKLEYTDPLFRRRLSQITKMTVHVVHNLLEKSHVNPETKIVFISLRGEIEREFTINKGLIEDGMILPAAFSLSVFNTPISSATLAFGLKGGYSVIYPSKNNFADALKTTVAPVLAGTEKEIILVYADELVPEVYGDKRPVENIPLAFAGIISSEKKENCLSFDDFSNISKSPVEFLKYVLK